MRKPFANYKFPTRRLRRGNTLLRSQVPWLALALVFGGLLTSRAESLEDYVTRPAAQISGVARQSGLKAEYYQSAGENYFAQRSELAVEDDLAFADLAPRLVRYTGGSSDHTAVRWTGKIQFQKAEEYTLYLIGDNGFRLWLDGRLVIDHWVNDWDQEQASAPIRAEAGSAHELKVEYFNATGGANLKFSWSSPGTPKAVVPASAFQLPEPLLAPADLQFYVARAKQASQEARVGKAVGCYPAKSVEPLRRAIRHAQTLIENGKASAAEMERALAVLAKMQNDLAASVIKEPFDARGNGNPVVPGYWADPTVFYDDISKLFYCFATVDGVDAGWQHDAHLARSKDMVAWEFISLSLPTVWPLPVPGKPCALWAPSIVRHPGNGKYYLTYFIEGKTYVALADSPLGPWKNATRGTTPATCHLNDAFDAQLFVDTDGKVYLSYAATEFKLCALKFDPAGLVSLDNDNPNMTDGLADKYKVIHRINVFGEGTAIYKKNGIYFLFYSEYGSQNYCVKYACAKSVWGPYTEQPGFVMKRDAARDILGPGHASLFEYGADTYIGYHRQHFPFVDSKRQTSVNRLTFDGPHVSLEVQNQAGLRAGNGALEKFIAKTLKHRETNLALGKTAIASSISDYQGGEFNGEVFAPIPQFYAARFAVDDNWGTRWMAGVEQATPSWLLVDLGADTAIGRTEIDFEHVRRLHQYKIEFLSQAEAANLEVARNSTAWKLYADRSHNRQKQSPLIDPKEVLARYLKLTILSADLPGPEQSRSPSRTDYLNRVSVVEFGVFAKPAAK